MKFSSPRILPSAVLFAWIVACIPLPAQPVDRAEVDALRARVLELESQLQRVLQRLDGAATAAVRSDPPASEDRDAPPVRVAAGDVAPVREESLQMHTLIHVDARQFLAGGGRDALILRRARLIAAGTAAPHARYRMVTDFGGSGVALLDANVSLELGAGLKFRAGKFKSPLGLEILHAAHAVALTERSPVSGLLPNRDVGAQVSASSGGGAMTLDFGVFNGALDGAHGGNLDPDRHRELIARFVARPFLDSSSPAGRGLSFGLGASHGRRRAADSGTAVYRSPGQQTYFSYRSDVRADGPAWRLSPQFEYRVGALGVFGEYAVSAARLRPAPGADALSLRHRAWQLTAAYVLTGEDSTAAGLAPRSDFDPGAGTWGAFEIVGRWAEVELDTTAFPRLAASEGNASGTRSLALGLNWHLSRAVRAMFDCYHTRFDAPVDGVAAHPRRDETLFVSRLQLAF